jgi:hypothetical protein
MAIRLPALALSAAHALSPEMSSGTIFYQRLRAIVRLEGLDKLKIKSNQLIGT